MQKYETIQSISAILLLLFNPLVSKSKKYLTFVTCQFSNYFVCPTYNWVTFEKLNKQSTEAQSLFKEYLLFIYIKEQRNIQGQKIHVMWSFFYFFNFALNCSSKRSIHIKLTLKFLIINKYNLLFINYNSITLKPQAVTIQQRNRNTHNLLKFQVLPWP